MDVIVPFGKYKGQPVTNLISDHKYVEWLKEQDWFSKHKIYNIVVNQNINTNQDSKTPAHNQIQNLFLKEENCMKIYKKLYPNADDAIRNYNNDVIKIKEYSKIPDFDKYFEIKGNNQFYYEAQFEADNNWDVKINIGTLDYNSFGIVEKYPSVFYEDKLYEKVVKERLRDEFHEEQKEFSKKHFKIKDARRIRHYFYIEIKPILSDDYPNVLRKMIQQVDFLNKKRLHQYEREIILLVKDFSSSVTSKDELISIFKQHKINVLFVKDLYGDVKLLSNNEETIESLKERIRFLEEENAMLRSNM
jgi:uncharacterized protein (DUF3820 family)